MRRLALLALLVAPFASAACATSIVIPADDAGSDTLPPDGDDGGDDAATCAVEQCGPIPPVTPMPLCWDGSTPGFTGNCVRKGDGTCGWEFRDCPPQKSCGAIPGGDCPSGTYCAHDIGRCSMPGDLGLCTLQPTGCSANWAPVCGCDGQTYGNDCEAARAGVSVASAGLCPKPGSCTPATADCGAGSFCDVGVGACSPSAAGTCAPLPQTCPATYVPVCGCDGKTYSNACVAQRSGVAIASQGACSTVRSCGGFPGTSCASTEYCDYSLAAMCGAADATGVCQPRPTVCDKTYAPVCACDGKTYSNECLANMAGSGVYYAGACK